MKATRAVGPVIACAMVLAGCGYIVTPEDESTPTPAATQGWGAVATKIDAAGSALHVDLTIRNDTGAWSAMQATPGTPAVLKTSDGKSTDCATVFVGTGGAYLAPGFQARGYTGGTLDKPATQLLYVECAGATAGAGSRLSIPYSYFTGDFNYYAPTAARSATLDIGLDKAAADLQYPVATPIDGVVEKADVKITAINKATLSLSKASRTADGLQFAWQAENPTEYPTYVHIGNPPVVGSDGIIYGFYQSPHLADAPITPAGQSAQWTTTVAAPASAKGLYILLSVESKQQKNFAHHALDITDK